MKTLYLDYETYYDDVYSLRKMTPVQYILDQRFECIGAAVAINDETPYWIDGSDLQAFFNTLDPNDTRVVSHNQLFDACISSWIYNFNPKLLVDTLGMARAMLSPYLRSLSLEKVATHLGIGIKGGTIHQVKGMNAAAIRAAGLWDAYTAYACNDVVLCRAIYGQLKHHFPVAEYVVNDSIIRCAITPQFQIDPNILAEHLAAVKASKETLLQACGLTSRDDLMSNEKFAGALRSIGVEPPMKTSLLTKKETYAFAKTDKDFTDLETHEDPRVQVLVAARLGVKSTIEETRTQRFLDIAALQWPAAWQAKRALEQRATQQVMPIALKYSGAHTHRLSGDWKLNQQNLGRGSPLRSSLVAPPGHSVVAVDASQIEARIVAWLAGEQSLLDLYEAGEDVYSSFASDIYGFKVNKKEHPVQRFVAKQAVLGLGFGMGAPRFEKQVKVDSYKQKIAIEMDAIEAGRVVNIYRTKLQKIPALWAKCQLLLPGMATGDAAGMELGPCIVEKQAIVLPSGQRLFYHNLQSTQDGWKYEYAGATKYLFGGKLTENIVQALARIVVMDAMLRLRSILNTYGVTLAHTVHDELVYVVPTELVTVVKAIVLEEMRRRPTWAPGLPLDAEAGSGPNYGEAK